jgi:hypothetical protein
MPAFAAPLPRVIGHMRIFPPLYSYPLVEIPGDAAIEAIFGLAGPHKIEDISVNGDLVSARVTSLEPR